MSRTEKRLYWRLAKIMFWSLAVAAYLVYALVIVTENFGSRIKAPPAHYGGSTRRQ